MASLKSVVAEGTTSVTAQFMTLRTEMEAAKRGILHVVVEKAKASDKAKQVLEEQLKAKLEVKRDCMRVKLAV